jgi:hypothetical protein
MNPDALPGVFARFLFRARERVLFLVLLASAVSVQAEAVVTPMARYEQFALGGQDIYRPTVGLEIASPDQQTYRVEAGYSLHRQGRAEGEHDLFHAIDLSASRRSGRHQVLGLFLSESDEPVAGGIKTFQAGAGYTYDVLRSESQALSLGAGLAMGGLGLELPDGTDLRILPVPLLQYRWKTDFVDIAFSCLAGPDLAVSGPRSGRLRLDGYLGFRRLREARDLDFDVSASYRLFAPDEQGGDFAGVMAGIRNASWHFQPAKGPSRDLSCYTPYLGLDLSFVRITGGAALAGRERRGASEHRNLGDGSFLAVQARLPLDAVP